MAKTPTTTERHEDHEAKSDAHHGTVEATPNIESNRDGGSKYGLIIAAVAALAVAVAFLVASLPNGIGNMANTFNSPSPPPSPTIPGSPTPGTPTPPSPITPGTPPAPEAMETVQLPITCSGFLTEVPLRDTLQPLPPRCHMDYGVKYGTVEFIGVGGSTWSVSAGQEDQVPPPGFVPTQIRAKGGRAVLSNVRFY